MRFLPKSSRVNEMKRYALLLILALLCAYGNINNMSALVEIVLLRSYLGFHNISLHSIEQLSILTVYLGYEYFHAFGHWAFASEKHYLNSSSLCARLNQPILVFGKLCLKCIDKSFIQGGKKYRTMSNEERNTGARSYPDRISISYVILLKLGFVNLSRTSLLPINIRILQADLVGLFQYYGVVLLLTRNPVQSCSFNDLPKVSTPHALPLVSSDSSVDHIEPIFLESSLLISNVPGIFLPQLILPTIRILGPIKGLHRLWIKIALSLLTSNITVKSPPQVLLPTIVRIFARPTIWHDIGKAIIIVGCDIVDCTWRPHPSNTLLGKGFSSDEIGDGPEPEMVTPRKSIQEWLRKGRMVGEERRRGRPPLLPLYKNLETKQRDDQGMTVQAMDSSATVHISNVSIGQTFAMISTSSVSSLEAIDSALAQLPLLEIMLSIPLTPLTVSWMTQADLIIDALESQGMGPFLTRSSGLKHTLERILAYPLMGDNCFEADAIRRMLAATLGDKDAVPPAPFDAECALRIIAACGIDSCMIGYEGGKILNSTLHINGIMRHSASLTMRQARYLCGECKVAVIRGIGDAWYSFEMQDALPSLERSYGILKAMLNDAFARTAVTRMPLGSFQYSPSRAALETVIHSRRNIIAASGRISSEEVSSIVQLMDESMDWMVVTRTISALESALVLDTPYHALGMLHALSRRSRNTEEFLLAQRVDLPVNWGSLTILIARLDRLVPSIFMERRRLCGLPALNKMVRSGSVPISGGRRIPGFGISQAMECLQLLFNVQYWSSIAAQWCLDTVLVPEAHSSDKFGSRAETVDIVVFRDLLIPLFPVDSDEFTLQRSALVATLKMQMSEAGDAEIPGTLVSGSELMAFPFTTLLRPSSWIRDMQPSMKVDFRPPHPTNPYLFEFTIPPPLPVPVTRFGRSLQARVLSQHPPPDGKHYTMPDDPRASSFMYFAEDPGRGLSAYALSPIPSGTCIGHYCGGENTSILMVKDGSYKSAYAWDDDVSVSLDARYHGSCAMRLLNDEIETREEVTNVQLTWNSARHVLEAVTTDHVVDIVRNQKLTTRYAAGYWMDPRHDCALIKKAYKSYGPSESFPDETWKLAMSLALKRERMIVHPVVPPPYVAMFINPDGFDDDEEGDLDSDMEPPLPHDLCDPPDDTLLQPKVPNLMSFVLNGQRIIPRLHPSASYRDQTLHPQIPQAPKNFGRHSRSTVAARCKSSKKRKKYRARHMSLGQEQMGQEEENPMHGPHSFPKSVAHAPVPRPSGIHVELPLPPGMNSDWRIQYSEDTQIRTGFWNVNGSPHTDHHVAETLAETMKLLGLSVLCLSDVRLTNAAGKWFSYRFKKYMPGAAVCIFPTTRESDKGARGVTRVWGGLLFLLIPLWRRS